MAREISIGAQGYEDIRVHGDFYVDKTGFVRDWWNARDQVTLICRPRRFGKTLNLDTVRCFLSTGFAGRGEELFGGLKVWADERMRALQGTVPVVALSFADVKATDYEGMLEGVSVAVSDACHIHDYLLEWEGLKPDEARRFAGISSSMGATACSRALQLTCSLLRRYHGAKPVVLLDEYDAPMERAWTGGYWDEASDLMRQLMNSTFKTNPGLGRALITGVTRVSRESIFSDLNNLEEVTSSTPKYQSDFGFTQAEVDASLAEYGLLGLRGAVREWYDGFVFDGVADIYNPWSITKFLESGGYLEPYWANTSGNGLVSAAVRAGDRGLKRDFETLMQGGCIERVIDEQVVFSELATRPDAVWALLLAAGYVVAPDPLPRLHAEAPRRLRLTNREVRLAFDRMATSWFAGAGESYGDLAMALLAGDAEAATYCLADVTLACMSSFDGANRTAESQPERFYHGLVLGLLASLRGRYSVESNRESGYGRYDVALVPACGANGSDPAVIVEFKVFDPVREQTLEDTVARARSQIEEKGYAAGLVERGITPDRIRTYGIAFRGKEVLVG